MVRVGPERFKIIIIIKLQSIVLYVAALPRVKSDTEKEVVWMDYKHGTLITWMMLFVGYIMILSQLCWGETHLGFTVSVISLDLAHIKHFYFTVCLAAVSVNVKIF